MSKLFVETVCFGAGCFVRREAQEMQDWAAWSLDRCAEVLFATQFVQEHWELLIFVFL